MELSGFVAGGGNYGGWWVAWRGCGDYGFLLRFGSDWWVVICCGLEVSGAPDCSRSLAWGVVNGLLGCWVFRCDLDPVDGCLLVVGCDLLLLMVVICCGMEVVGVPNYSGVGVGDSGVVWFGVDGKKNN
uniref:Uncharacterized protein n=1 Tax=Fagus sylvatica TaxID=28930 RepID=A0A2N9J2D0_FAGSY